MQYVQATLRTLHRNPGGGSGVRYAVICLIPSSFWIPLEAYAVLLRRGQVCDDGDNLAGTTAHLAATIYPVAGDEVLLRSIRMTLAQDY